MKIFFLIVAFLSIVFIRAQSNDLHFKEISNTVVADKRANILQVGTSYEFVTLN